MSTNKIAGYNGQVHLSSDGSLTWHNISAITNAEVSFEINTQNETTWDDKGFVNIVPNTITGRMRLEGLYSPNDYGQDILEKSSLNKRKIRVKFWRNYKDNNKYYEFNAYITSYITPQDVENKAQFKAELSIDGQSLKTIKS